MSAESFVEYLLGWGTVGYFFVITVILQSIFLFKIIKEKGFPRWNWVWWMHLRDGGFLCVRTCQDILKVPRVDTTFAYVIPAWLGLGLLFSSILLPVPLIFGKYWLALFIYLSVTAAVMSVGQMASVFYEYFRDK